MDIRVDHMGFFDTDRTKGNNTALAKADSMRDKAADAADRNEDSRAAELYFRAAELYADAGERYWEKHCESWGWSLKAKAVVTRTLDGSQRCADYYDRSIQADNSALQYIAKEDPSHSVTEGNMRFTEGDKYTALANIEVEKANATSGTARSMHLRSAAEYRLSGAQTMKLAAGISKRDGKMEGCFNRIGVYHRDRSGYHYYRASAESELENWNSAFEEFEASRKEREQAMEFHRRSLGIRSDRNVKNNLKQDKAMLKKLKKEISNILKEAEREKKRRIAVAGEGAPNLDVEVKAVEGMMQNLVSTLSVVLSNTGTGEARNIVIKMESPFLEGEKITRLTSLPAERSTNMGLSVVPTRAGNPKASLMIMYEDARKRKYRYKGSEVLNVADPEERRPPPTTIYNVQGDLIGEGASKVDIRDSVIQRSNIGKDISVKKGIDEKEFVDTVRKLDRRNERRARGLGKGQRELKEDVRKVSRDMKRYFNKISKELPYPSSMEKKRGVLVMKYTCALCEAEVGTVRDRRWTHWLHFGIAGAMAGVGMATLNPEMGMKGLKKLYEDFTEKPLDDLPREKIFLTERERDKMVRQLREWGIISELNHCPECGRWVCSDCFDPDEQLCNEDLW